MNLASLFGTKSPRDRRAHDPTRVWTGAADKTPVHTLLDQRGVPWRATVGELAERYGVAGGMIQIATPRPFLPGLARPLMARADQPLDAPASEFTALVRFGDDPAEDVRRTAEEVGQYLGRAIVRESREGAECLWRFGVASVGLHSTPDGCEISVRLA